MAEMATPNGVSAEPQAAQEREPIDWTKVWRVRAEVMRANPGPYITTYTVVASTLARAARHGLDVIESDHAKLGYDIRLVSVIRADWDRESND